MILTILAVLLFFAAIALVLCGAGFFAALCLGFSIGAWDLSRTAPARAVMRRSNARRGFLP